MLIQLYERQGHQVSDALPETLSQYVARIRAQKGLSLPEVRRRGGPSVGWMNTLENGLRRDRPKPETLEKLAKGLGVSVAEVMAAAGLSQYGLPEGGSGPNTQTTEQGKTPKPWSHHDFSQSSEENKGGEPRSVGNDLSTLSRNSSETGKETVNLNGRTGDASHITLLSDIGEWRRLPVFRVSCGDRVLINDEPSGWASWPAMMVGSADGVMKVEGTSMLGCGFKPGDLLFYERINGTRPQSGDKVIADLGDDGAICKLYRRDESGEYLVSAPGEAESFFCRITESVRLVGIVRSRHTIESTR